MFQIWRSFLVLVLATATTVRATSYPSPESCSGFCWAHDPAVIQRASDGKYFKFNTGAGLQYASATSLNGPWKVVGDVLPDGSSISNSGSDDPWAPDITNIGGTYHLYYAVSTFGTQKSAIGLATRHALHPELPYIQRLWTLVCRVTKLLRANTLDSTTLDAGSWTDHGSIGVTSTSGKAYNAIDPNLFIYNGGASVSGGASLMNFGSFYGDIYQVKLNTALTSTAGSAAYNIEYDSTGTRPCEGSYMFQYGSYYYLLWSYGICCNYDTAKPASGDEYEIRMCRSTTATGGFVDKDGLACTANGGSVLLKSHGVVYGPGGQGVFTSTTEGLVLYYHYAHTTVGLADSQYLFGWNKLKISSGWPVVSS